MIRFKCVIILILIVCGSQLLSSLMPAVARAAEQSTAPDTKGFWVASDDNSLALRCYAEKSRVARDESIRLNVELQNDGTKPITVMRPEGDWFAAQTSNIKLWNATSRLKYAGPIPTYVVGAGGFVTLAPGETHKDTIELHVANFPGGERPGRYTLRFDYSYHGQWLMYAEKQGVKNPRHGHISSREIQVDRD